MSCFTCYGPQYRLRISRSFQRGFASLDSPPSPAGASGAGVAGSGPELLPPGIAWGAPAASRTGPEAAARSAAQGMGEVTGRPAQGGSESRGRPNRGTLRQSGQKKPRERRGHQVGMPMSPDKKSVHQSAAPPLESAWPITPKNSPTTR